jgi:hypothetical protein
MADPEIPGVRAEIQREDRPYADASYAGQHRQGLGIRPYLWAAFLIAVIAIIAFAYGLF